MASLSLAFTGSGWASRPIAGASEQQSTSSAIFFMSKNISSYEKTKGVCSGSKQVFFACGVGAGEEKVGMRY
jgi:hypothetical protein